MMKHIFFALLLSPLLKYTETQKPEPAVKHKLDSIVNASPFNGLVMIARGNRVEYMCSRGLSDITKGNKLDGNSHFVIGSISKQFAAAMVLKEYEKGNIDLHATLKTYLSELKMGWADTVTVDQLLTHMHGIRDFEGPLEYVPGTRFNYFNNNQGYWLLARIVEKVSGKNFAEYSDSFFLNAGLINTFHPKSKRAKNILKGYRKSGGIYVVDSFTFAPHPAAGAYVSTAADLVKWNNLLHGGKVLKPETYNLMIGAKPGAVRDHPIFSRTLYAYGITTLRTDQYLQLGQTGFTGGFASMCFYYPLQHLSLIVLCNCIEYPEDLSRTFDTHVKIRNAFLESALMQ